MVVGVAELLHTSLWLQRKSEEEPWQWHWRGALDHRYRPAAPVTMLSPLTKQALSQNQSTAPAAGWRLFWGDQPLQINLQFQYNILWWNYKDIKYERSKTVGSKSLHVHQLSTDKACRCPHACIHNLLVFAEGLSNPLSPGMSVGSHRHLLPLGSHGRQALLFPSQGWTVLQRCRVWQLSHTPFLAQTAEMWNLTNSA